MKAMETQENKYGKSLLNPIKINGVSESINFINSLVTDDEKPFLYHRLRSTMVGDSKPIDCYEIMNAKGETDYLFIDVYATKSKSEAPEGYLCKPNKLAPTVIKGFGIMRTTGVNVKVRKFPEDLF